MAARASFPAAFPRWYRRRQGVGQRWSCPRRGCLDVYKRQVLYHQHPDLFQLLAQLLDVIADNAVVDVHVAAVVEHVEGAGDVDFQRRGDVLRLFLILRPQQVV